MDRHCLLLLLLLLSTSGPTASFLLYAPIDSGGIRGNVTFFQEDNSEEVQISFFLHSLLEGPAQPFDWAIHEFPVFFDLKNPCQATELGKSIFELSQKHGQVTIPSPNGTVLKFIDNNIRLRGKNSIWARSLYLKSSNSTARACSNIMSLGKTTTAIATFTQNIAGSILFRENELHETMIFSNLFYTLEEYRSSSRNDWKVMVTDILDVNTEFKCNHLQILLDPDNVDDVDCNLSNHHHCKIGDMVQKHGQVVVGNNNNRYSKKFFLDHNFSLEYLDSNRKLFVVIYEKNSNKVASCAKIVQLKPKEAKAHFDLDGVKGDITLKQNYKIDPTIITVKLKNLRGRGKFYHVHQFPFMQRQDKNQSQCSPMSVGERFNPLAMSSQLEPIAGTNDQYEVGDLSGKHGVLSEAQDLSVYFNSHLDFNLPLFGSNSIIGRSIVISNRTGQGWICANIAYPERTLVAKAIFYYPITGSIMFRQLEEDPYGDTTVFGELFYSDGTLNITRNHIWRIHVNEAGRDFYNWTKRCMSSGESYNPFGITLGRNYNSHCSADNQLRCQVGDLYLKSRKIDVNSYPPKESTKFFYTDTLLPLSGPNSIVARSVVVEDENAPAIRGRRLACTTIRRQHPITAVVDQWRSSSGVSSNVSGYLELYQETEFDETRGRLYLKGLNRLAGGYHVHKVSVPLDKEFPCSADTVYGHYNPFEIDSSIVPYSAVGSVDEYETGDLSGKFGPLTNLDIVAQEFIDANLPVIGLKSVIGRSMVIHKQDGNFRWTCGTIKPKVTKREREIVAIASFDDPRNLIHGYVRFQQVEFFDGSLSDTWIEVYLRHGTSNRKNSYGHRWSIYVNPVGADAFNEIDSVRCLAGGYMWNPYLTKIDEFYKMQCNPRNYLRCALGDLTGRHGPLAIGGDRHVYSDSNLPLVGNYSVLNRALVISIKNHSETALACANIKIDKHLVSTVVIHKVPAFTVAKFLQHMRSKLNAAEWLIVAEVQKIREINNKECIQMIVHFNGDEAWRLQSEFNNLIEYGSVKRSQSGELIKTYYKSCKAAMSSASYSVVASWLFLSLPLITILNNL